MNLASDPKRNSTQFSFKWKSFLCFCGKHNRNRESRSSLWLCGYNFLFQSPFRTISWLFSGNTDKLLAPNRAIYYWNHLLPIYFILRKNIIDTELFIILLNATKKYFFWSERKHFRECFISLACEWRSRCKKEKSCGYVPFLHESSFANSLV